MKTQIVKILSLAYALSCVSLRAQDPAPIQGIDRDAKGVDASIHASVDDAYRREPPQEDIKRPTASAGSHSHWGFSTSLGEPPNTRFWPAPPVAAAAAPPAAEIPSHSKKPIRAPMTGGVSFRAAGQTPASSVWPAPVSGLEMDPRSDGNSEIAAPLPDPFQSLAFGRPQDGSMDSRRFKTVVPRSSLQPETPELPGPIREKSFGLAGGSSSPLPSPFSQAAFFVERGPAKAKPRKNRPRKSPDVPRDGGAAGSRVEREKADRHRRALNTE